MVWFSYFFRSTPDGYVFPIWGFKHIGILLIALLGVQLIIFNKKKLRNSSLGNILKFSLIIILGSQQLILYLWYGFSGYFTIHESLPLYNCRIAIIFIILGLITDKKIFKNVGCYWGFVGSILALMMPTDLDPFLFPHYTSISFFVGHISLLWASVYILVISEYRLNKKSLKSMLYFSNIYNLTIYVFNVFTKSNYCYVIEPPFAKELIAGIMSPISYTLTAFAIFNLAIMLVFMTAKTIYRTLEIDEDLTTFAS